MKPRAVLVLASTKVHIRCDEIWMKKSSVRDWTGEHYWFEICSSFLFFRRVLCVDGDMWRCGELVWRAGYVAPRHVHVLNFIRRDAQKREYILTESVQVLSEFRWYYFLLVGGYEDHVLLLMVNVVAVTEEEQGEKKKKQWHSNEQNVHLRAISKTYDLQHCTIYLVPIIRK